MSTPHEEAGLGDFLEFADDEAVTKEILGRGEYGLVLMVKPSASNKPEQYDLKARYRLPDGLIEEHGKEGAISILLDMLKDLVNR